MGLLTVIQIPILPQALPLDATMARIAIASIEGERAHITAEWQSGFAPTFLIDEENPG